MPNHLHCVLFFPTKDYDLNKLVGNDKRFMAYDIIKRLKVINRNNILLQLQEGLTAKQLDKSQ